MKKLSMLAVASIAGFQSASASDYVSLGDKVDELQQAEPDLGATVLTDYVCALENGDLTRGLTTPNTSVNPVRLYLLKLISKDVHRLSSQDYTGISCTKAESLDIMPEVINVQEEIAALERLEEGLLGTTVMTPYVCINGDKEMKFSTTNGVVNPYRIYLGNRLAEGTKVLDAEIYSDTMCKVDR